MEYSVVNSSYHKVQGNTWISNIKGWLQTAVHGLNSGATLLDLGIRLYIANVFFKAGLTKIANWNSTIALFENEYAVPLLPPDIAAYLGTAVELGIPVLLLLGLGTRLAAIVLFVFNIIAVISYPDISEAGRNEHMLWGLLMLVTIFHGPGKLSLDHLIRSKFWAASGH